MFKSTLTIATSFFLFMSGAADLFALKRSINNLEEESNKKGLMTINHINNDSMQEIFLETSKSTNPRHLASVCKYWYSIMRENNIPQMAELHYSTTNILHLSMNPFMQKCMHTYWDNLFDNGILRYMPLVQNRKVIEDRTAVTLKFSDFKGRKFDLSACGDLAQDVVITENMTQFYKVGEENEGKTVIGIMPSHRIQQDIKNTPDHPFASLMKACEADIAPVNIFWRRGNNKNVFRIDYLTTKSMSNMSSCDLYSIFDAERARALNGPSLWRCFSNPALYVCFETK